MKFSHARICRRKIEYYKDALGADFKFTMTFPGDDPCDLEKWLHDHPDCTITQCLIRYVYPYQKLPTGTNAILEAERQQRERGRTKYSQLNLFDLHID